MNRLLLGGLTCLAVGCSSYEPDPGAADTELELLESHYGATRTSSVLVVPVQSPRLDPPGADESRGLMRLDLRSFEHALTDALGRVLAPEQRVEVAPVGSAAAPAYALANGFDVVLEVDVTRFNATFLDTTGWWYPNAFFVGWYFWPVGSWFMADERYGIDCAADVRVLDTHSERGLSHGNVDVVSPVDEDDPRKAGVVPAPDYVFSDSDRGLGLFGTWFPGDLSESQWESVGALLQPVAERHLALRVAGEVASALDQKAQLSEEERLRRYSTAQAVVIGLSAYSEAPCFGAREDAEAFAALLRGELAQLTPSGEQAGALEPWLPEKNLELLCNAQASSSAIVSGLAAAAERCRPEDTLVVYVAGRGRLAEGELELVDFEGVGLRLSELAEHVQGCAATRRVFVFDVDFVEGPRGLPGTGHAPGPEALRTQLRALFHPEGEGAAVLASSLGVEERVQAHAADTDAGERGLLTHFLLRCLRGEGDEDRDGLTWGDVETYLEARVFEFSEVALPHPQRPLLVAQVKDAPVGPAPAARD